MPRPKGSTTKPAAAPVPSTEREVQLTIPYADFMEYQNKLSSILNTYHSMASTYAGAAASFMNAVSASMKIVQHYTKHWPLENGLQNVKFDGYPDLEKMMSVDGGPTFDPFPSTAIRQTVSDLPTVNAVVAAPVGIAPMAPVAPVAGSKAEAKKDKKPKKPKDPNAPKRPVTAYFVYLEERREPIARELGPDSKPGDVQQKATEEWNALADEAKESYRARYRVKLEQYQREVEAYKKRKAEMGEAVEDIEGPSTLINTTVVAPEAETSPVAKKRGPSKSKAKAVVKADEEVEKTPVGASKRKSEVAAETSSKKRKSEGGDRSSKKRKSEVTEAEPEPEPKKKGGRKKKGGE